MEVVGRTEAMRLGLTRYFTGKPCKRGHIAERTCSSAICLECGREKAREPSFKQKCKEYNESRVEYRKQRYLEKREEILEKQKKYVEKNWDVISEKRAAMRKTAEYKEMMRQWREKNKFSIYQRNSERRAAKLRGCPKWLTKEDKRVISSIYEMAARLSECLGIKHHVDHIIPLQGEGVCGLHVPWNLAPIPASINIRKRNKLLVEEPSYKDQIT